MSIGSIKRAHRQKHRIRKAIEEYRNYLFEELEFDDVANILYSLDSVERTFDRIIAHAVDAAMRKRDGGGQDGPR